MKIIFARPIILLTIFLASIIWLQSILNEVERGNVLFLLALLSVFIILFIYSKFKEEANYVIPYLACSLLFLIYSHSHWQYFHPKIISQKNYHIENLEAKVIEHQIGKEKDVLKIVWLENGEQRIILLTSLYRIKKKLFYGDSITCSLILKTIPKKRLFENFDSEQYYGTQHISFLSFNYQDSIQYRISNNYHIYRLAQRTRAYFMSILTASFENTAYAALMCGLILGEKSDLPNSIKQSFINTGTAHILAVSGLHLGMVYALIKFLFSIVPIARIQKGNFQLITTLSLIWYFSFITGLGASVLRASIMFSLFELGMGIKRYTSSVCILFGTAFIMLFMAPCQLFDIGFQLSFCAVLSIILFQFYFRKILISNSKILNKIWENAAVTISVQMLMLPISLYYFHQFPTYFLPANLIWIPLSFVLMLLGIIIFPISIIFNWALKFIVLACTKSIEFGLFTFSLIEKLPFYILDGIFLNPIQILSAFGFIIFIYFYLSQKHTQYYYYGILFFILYLSQFPIKIWMQSNSKEIIFYSMKGKEVIDYRVGLQIFTNDSTYVIRGSPIWNYRGAHHINKISFVNSEGTKDIFSVFQVILNSGSHKKFHIIHGCTNPWQSLSEFSKDTFILGNTLEPGARNKWKYQLSKQNIFFHDLKRDGSFVIEM